MVVGLLGVLKAGGGLRPARPGVPAPRASPSCSKTRASTFSSRSAELAARCRRQRGRARLSATTRAQNRGASVGGLAGESTPAQPGLRHLHVGLDRTAEGRRGHATRGLLNLVHWHRRAYALTATIATPLSSRAAAFDASVWELWPCLCGRRERSRAVRRDSAVGRAALRVGCASRPSRTASHPPRWPSCCWTRRGRTSPRCAFCSPAASARSAKRRRRPACAFEFVNHYGPTEATAVTTCETVSAEGEGVPTIGRPTAPTRASTCWTAAAAGAARRRRASCTSAATGWRAATSNRPDLTAERFVPTVRDASPARVCTGRATSCAAPPDGRLEFLGRARPSGEDARLTASSRARSRRRSAAHPAVRECVVVAREDAPAARSGWSPTSSAAERRG